MAYTVDFTDGTKPSITVTNAGVDTSTNIALVGQGYTSYGEVVAEDLLHLLENFASGSAPTKPVEGQFWFDSVNKSPKYFDNTVSNSGNWKSLSSMTVQAGPPIGVGEADGHFWLDIGTGELYLYYNGTWVSIGNSSTNTRIIARSRFDTLNVAHETLETIVNGQIVTIYASDKIAVGVDSNGGFVPQTTGFNTEYLEDGVTLLSTHFPTIKQGENMNLSDEYIFNGTALDALYADLAERYEADAVYPYGTVVKIGGNKEITQTDKDYCSDVFGVISDNPAVRMNSGAGDSKTHPYVALSGRIPCRVVGKVNKGERLVSSTVPGHAMAGTDGLYHQVVIGRALETKINDEAGIIEIVVGTK